MKWWMGGVLELRSTRSRGRKATYAKWRERQEGVMSNASTIQTCSDRSLLECSLWLFAYEHLTSGFTYYKSNSNAY